MGYGSLAASLGRGQGLFVKFHPAILMIMLWAACTLAFLVLPFRLEDRVISLYGLMVLILFIATFCFGAMLTGRPQAQRPVPDNVRLDFRLTDRILLLAGLVAVVVSCIDIAGRDIFDLTAAYEVRTERAGALMEGAASQSGIWSQIAYLFYPAGYAALIRELAFRQRPIIWRIGVFGFLPILLTSLAIGGRAPLFYAILTIGFAYVLRNRVFQKQPAKAVPTNRRRRRTFKLGPLSKAAAGVTGLGAGLYFMQVFLARADVAGGIDAMFGIAARSWGVSFNGRFSNAFFSLLGVDGTYLIFVSSWYFVQGLVISQDIFAVYDGPMMYGTYGIDILSAIMRRVDSAFVADGFNTLVSMNAYGFFPSAFGSLYVDFRFFGLLPCLLWGCAAGRVYAEIRRGHDPRWLMLAPVVTIGILASVINTPLGFSNGLITHAWLAVAFLATRRVQMVRTPLGPTASRVALTPVPPRIKPSISSSQ